MYMIYHHVIVLGSSNSLALQAFNTLRPFVFPLGPMRIVGGHHWVYHTCLICTEELVNTHTHTHTHTHIHTHTHTAVL